MYEMNKTAEKAVKKMEIGVEIKRSGMKISAYKIKVILRVVTFNLIFDAFLSFSHMKNPSTSCTAFLMLLLEVFKACSMTNRSASLFFTLFSCPTSTVSPDHVCVCIYIYIYIYIHVCV